MAARFAELQDNEFEGLEDSASDSARWAFLRWKATATSPLDFHWQIVYRLSHLLKL